MEKKGVSPVKIAAAYIGTVVGAGFATGQEIMQFFVAFGRRGLLGIALTTVMFIVFGIIIMELGRTLTAQSYLEVLRHAGGQRLGAVMDVLLAIFLFCSLTAMLAGTGALFRQQFGLTEILGNLIMIILTAATVLRGRDGVFNAISLVVPLLLLSVIGISAYSLVKTPPELTGGAVLQSSGMMKTWLWSAILYVSYNATTSISVLGPLGGAAAGRKAIIKGGILGGLGLGAVSAMIYLAISGNISNLRDLEVPMLYISGRISRAVQLGYAVVLIAEIYTTAVGSLYGLSARMVSINKSPTAGRAVIMGVAVVALLASLLGFTNIVKYLYPLVGYAGLFILISILYARLK